MKIATKIPKSHHISIKIACFLVVAENKSSQLYRGFIYLSQVKCSESRTDLNMSLKVVAIANAPTTIENNILIRASLAERTNNTITIRIIRLRTSFTLFIQYFPASL